MSKSKADSNFKRLCIVNILAVVLFFCAISLNQLAAQAIKYPEIINEQDLIPVRDLSGNINVLYLGDKPESFIEFTGYYTRNFVSSDSLLGEGCLSVIILTDSLKFNSLLQIAGAEKAQDIVVIDFTDCSKLASIKSQLLTYICFDSNSMKNQVAASEILFGGRAFPYIRKGEIHNSDKIRLQYIHKDSCLLDSKTIEAVEAIVREGIAAEAMPGCQIYIAKNGKVLMDKAFGYQTYQNNRPVEWSDLYDLASVTKVAATTLATISTMKKQNVKLNDKIGDYLSDNKVFEEGGTLDTVIIDQSAIIPFPLRPENGDSIVHFADTTIVLPEREHHIFNRTFRQLLLHKSGLPPVGPIVDYILWNRKKFSSLHDDPEALAALNASSTRADTLEILFSRYFSKEYIEGKAFRQIADSMYLLESYFDTIWEQTRKIKVDPKSRFVYSDLNMILLQMTLDSINGCDMDNYLKQNIYYPIGAHHTSFNPLCCFDTLVIAPTANEEHFRMQLLQGFVHDESAALQGGIAGNAGLFGNAHDLGILFQMIMQNGTYGGIQYLDKDLLKLFLKKEYGLNRGLGFDYRSGSKKSDNGISENTYGHTGFTGTCVWTDPDNQIVFVFISNRVHPTVKHNNISKLKIIRRIQQEIYKELVGESK